MRIFTRLATALSVAAFLVVGTGPAQADAPTIERIEFEETFHDDFLTGECGVDVTTTVRGFTIFKQFTGAQQNLLQLTTVNITGTATSDFGTMRFKNVGADHMMVAPDGTVTLRVIGQLPFEFTGVLVFDLGTGEVIKVPHFRGEEQVGKACRFLAP
ncbi:hypothetical protein N802_06675 [Knoellia sinensis KCTC 19936]|uniref:Uncharacterized protein n=1 Tax=Knoellia sinensis KCTC 19936 TaxID=1385520 RepID=A0A0A0J1E7_9MICO|nr:hypothetical protein [Knoellia sinensis]KGN30494.1 hypothetical protein N802_06675 [Knoellia sinensis KCTC 19936]